MWWKEPPGWQERPRQLAQSPCFRAGLRAGRFRGRAPQRPHCQCTGVARQRHLCRTFFPSSGSADASFALWSGTSLRRCFGHFRGSDFLTLLYGVFLSATAFEKRDIHGSGIRPRFVEPQRRFELPQDECEHGVQKNRCSESPTAFTREAFFVSHPAVPLCQRVAREGTTRGAQSDDARNSARVFEGVGGRSFAFLL